ncbi:major facilitator superfamily domain-containing protein [Circinella umbellata]|nr:major facilitator superfamily domain-containing protein [Circinella umbellata]
MHNNSSTSNRQQKDTSRVVLEKDSVAILDIDHSPDLYKEDVDESKSIEANTTLSTEPSSLSISTRVFIFIGLQIALLLTAMDRIIITTALPRMTSDFSAASLSTWVATSYMLAITTLMPLCSKLSDIFGRKNIILIGIVNIILGSIIGGFSQSMGMLIAGRIIQGLGAAGIHIIIADIVPLRQRGIYQSVLDSIYALSYTISPLLGGAFSEYLSWRWTFYINLPLGAISFITLVIWLKLPAMKQQESFNEKLKRIDFAGTLIIMACITSFLLAMNFGGQLYPWNSLPVVLLIVFSGILLLVLLVVEAKIPKEPLLPLRILTNRSLLGSFCANTVFGGVFTSALYVLPNYFQIVKGDEAMWAGIRILPMLLVIPLVSIVTGIVISRAGIYRYFITGSMAIMMIGVGLISKFTIDTPWSIIYGSIAGFGIGCAPMFSSLIISVQAAVPSADVAVASGLAFLLFDIGAAIGIAITSAVLNTRLNHLLPNTMISTEYVSMIIQDPMIIRSRKLPQQYFQTALDIYAQSLRDSFLVLLAFPAIGFLASLLIKHFTLRKYANIDIKNKSASSSTSD